MLTTALVKYTEIVTKTYLFNYKTVNTSIHGLRDSAGSKMPIHADFFQGRFLPITYVRLTQLLVCVIRVY